MNPAALPPGTAVGPWRVVELRGRGSYGVVYRVVKVEDVDARPFALKLALHPLDPRFEREAELLSRLRHPCVPRLQDRGWWVLPGGVPFPFLVMEWVEGVPLYEWAARHPPTSRQTLRLLAQVARALEATHAAGGVHRDVKGDNVLVREDGTAVLMDFGSGNYHGARTLTHQPPPPGTPQYQSPECLRFQWETRASRTARYEATPADDLYALGVMAWRFVTGRYPPPIVDIEETEDGARLIELPRVPVETGVSLCPELAVLLRQLLSPEPLERGSAAEMAPALERAARTAGSSADQPITSLTVRTRRRNRRPFPGWLAAAAGVALVIGAWWSWKRGMVAQEGSPEDGGAVGLGETVNSAPATEAPPEPAQTGIGLNVPKKPLPGQRRPPCEKREVEINGGCWARWADATPPCGPRSYEWKSGCYVPLFDPPRPDTSGRP